VINDSVTGFLAAPESPVALADALLRGLQLTPEDRRRLGAAARDRILQQFSHARTLVAYEHLFQSLLDPDA
jgi:glycosyltransferase involved in cell wall biosynthesis